MEKELWIHQKDPKHPPSPQLRAITTALDKAIAALPIRSPHGYMLHGRELRHIASIHRGYWTDCQLIEDRKLPPALPSTRSIVGAIHLCYPEIELPIYIDAIQHCVTAAPRAVVVLALPIAMGKPHWHIIDALAKPIAVIQDPPGLPLAYDLGLMHFGARGATWLDHVKRSAVRVLPPPRKIRGATQYGYI